MTTMTTQTSGVSPTVVPPIADRKVVNCVTGGIKFAIPTDNLAGVYQVSREQLEDNLAVVDTPEGKMPVVSAAELLRDELGFEIENSDHERDLVAIRHEGQVVALRVASVARPVKLAANGWNHLPKIAVHNDPRGIIAAVATVNPKATNPSDIFSLVVDPLVALGLKEGTLANDDSESSGNRPHKSGGAQIIPQRRGSGQLLAFVPEDVPRGKLDYVFSLPLAAVAEVVTAHEDFESPLESKYFEGYVMWRDMPVPVVNLAACFGLMEEGHRRRERVSGRRLVIARAAGHKYIAFYTQTQMHSMKTPSSSLVEIDELAGTPLLGAFKTSFGAMVIPDLDRILNYAF